MEKSTVLICAESDDLHALAVMEQLRVLGSEPCFLARELCFNSWTIQNFNDNIIIELASGAEFDSNSIRSVFWRKYLLEPHDWSDLHGMEAPVADFLLQQRSIHFDSAFELLAHTCPFLNDIEAGRKSASQPLQHHVARSCDLLIPETYVGSNPRRAEQFVRHLWETGRRCSTKNVRHGVLLRDGKPYTRRNRIFSEFDLPKLAGLVDCPMVFQEYIEKKYEYRVTVVGREIYTCRIDSQAAGGATSIDWKNYNIPSTPHHAVELDPTLNAKLVLLVGLLGLVYGAVDLVENPDGDFYFLEINSMCHWLWIEDLTGLPITSAVARYLAHPNAAHD